MISDVKKTADQKMHKSIETLKGRGPRDVTELSVRLATRMLVLSGGAAGEAEADARVRQALASGAALEKFRDIIAAQGGDPKVVDDYARLPAAAHREDWRAPRDGIVAWLDAELIGRAAVALGAGRDRADAAVDAAAGIDITAPSGTRVRAGEPVLVLGCSDPTRAREARALVDEAVVIDDDGPAERPLVIDTIRG